MAIPGYVLAIVYSGILDFTGSIQSFIRTFIGINPGNWKFFDIMNINGAILVISLTLYPYIYLPVKNAFNNYALNYIEPAISLGKKNWFFKILIPIILPATLGGGALVLMETLNDYGVVNYFGVQVFQTGIFRAWFSLGDVNSAMRLSSILLIFAIIIIIFERVVIKKGRFSASNRINKNYKKIKLNGIKEILVISIVSIPVFFGFIIPVLQLIFWFLRSFKRVLDIEFINLIFNTISLGLGAVIVCLIFSTIAALLNNTNKGSTAKVFSLITIGYAIPGSVIAVGVMVIFGALDRAQSVLIFSGTIFALLYSYNIRFMAVAFKPINAGLITINSGFKEVSKSLGVPWYKTLFKVELSMLQKSFLVSSILLFIDLLKELPLTIILRPFNYNTLATEIYEMAKNEMIPESSVPSLLLIIIGLIPIYILNKLSVRKYETNNKKS